MVTAPGRAIIAAQVSLASGRLPTMSASSKGGAKLGSGLSVDGDALNLGPLTHSGSGASVETDGSGIFGVTGEGFAHQDGTPTPDSPVEIEVARGRNLAAPNFSASATDNGITYTPNSDGSITAVGTATADSYVKIGPNASWVNIFSCGVLEAGTYVKRCSFTDAKVRVGVGVNSTFKTYDNVFTLDEPTEVYLGVYLSSGTHINEKFTVQLEKGSTPTPYVPYGHIGLDVTANGQTTTTPIPLPSKGFAGALPDGTADMLAIDSAGRWEWTNATNEVVLDGGSDETWSYESSNQGFRLHSMTDEFAKMGNNSTNCFSSHFRPAAWSERGTSGIMAFSSYKPVFCYTSVTQNTASWLTWLAANPVTVLYPLATPTTEHGYIELPELPAGATVSIPELEAIGVSWFVPGASEIAEHVANVASKLREELADTEEAIADLATRVAALES